MAQRKKIWIGSFLNTKQLHNQGKKVKNFVIRRVLARAIAARKESRN
jgi:hypothetical protein